MLVTLGIIGVVAVMTIAPVINNYRKTVLVNQFKKEVNFVQNNLKKIMADEGVDDIFSTSAGIKNYRGDYVWWGMQADKLASFMGLTPVSENTKFYQDTRDGFGSGGDNYYSYFIKDGSCIAFANGESSRYPVSGSPNLTMSFLFDVNCDKGPNIAGRDRFIVNFDSNARFSEPMNFELSGIDELCKKTGEFSDESLAPFVSVMSLYCSHSIIKNSWRMIY